MVPPLPEPAGPPPETPGFNKRVFAPRKKRAFLSFRRKSDLVLFLLSVGMFAAAVTLFVFLQRRPPAPVDLAKPVERAMAEPVPTPARIAEVKVPADAMDTGAQSFNMKASTAIALPVTDSAAVEQASTAPEASAAGRSFPPPVKKAAFPVPSKVKTGRAPAAPAAAVELLTDGAPWRVEDTADGWVYARLTEAGGRRALRVTYSLEKPRRVRVAQAVPKNVSGHDRLHFVIKGGGAASVFEIRLTDADGTAVAAAVPRRARPGKWTPFEIRPSQLEMKAPGRDGRFDRNRARELTFAVTEEAAGGAGEFFLSEVSFLP